MECELGVTGDSAGEGRVGKVRGEPDFMGEATGERWNASPISWAKLPVSGGMRARCHGRLIDDSRLNLDCGSHSPPLDFSRLKNDFSGENCLEKNPPLFLEPPL